MVIRRGELEDQVQFEGWKQLSYNGDIQIHFRFEDVLIEKSDVKENVEILKDKSGKETGRKSNFILQVTYSYGASARIVDQQGLQLAKYILSSRDQKRVHSSEPFPTAAEANAYFKYGVILLTQELIKQSARNSISNLNHTLTTNYGYPERTVSDFFWILDSRKHPEYENHRRAWIDFKQAITGMSADEPLDRIKNELKPVIDYYNGIKKKYSSGSKWDKKLRYASYYNLSKIYLYLDDPDEAMKWANELVINGFDAKDGQRLEASASNLKLQLRVAKRSTRHFPMNPDQYQMVGGGGK